MPVMNLFEYLPQNEIGHLAQVQMEEIFVVDNQQEESNDEQHDGTRRI